MLGKVVQISAKVFVLPVFAGILVGCAYTPDEDYLPYPTENDSNYYLKNYGDDISRDRDNTRGVYDAFPTDNVVPYTPDHDEEYYPLYYYSN